MSSLYHFQVGFPRDFNARVGVVDLQYTQHALEAASKDRYGLIKLPKILNTHDALCIEVELDGAEVIKLVYRQSYSPDLDLCFAVSPARGHFKVRTAWLNSKADKHKTLDVTKYEKVG